MSNTVTIYITKYALTSGVLVVDGELTSTGGYRYKRSAIHYSDYACGLDVHLSFDAAMARAEEMRIAKLKSLDKQMKKVNAMKFEVKS